MNRPLTTAQIFTHFLPRYRENHPLSPQQAKITNLLCGCRTEALGGRRLHCTHCDYGTEQYHSCRNRHCPQCQQQASAAWLEQRQEDLLPIPYYHLVFTLPHSLNAWVQLHPDEIYALLFKVVWKTLKCFGRDPKRLGGELGMTAVLHTWGQNLSQHVHLHCLIPGGALAGNEWHHAKSTYLFPVRALSRHVRGNMVSELRKAVESGVLPRLTDSRATDRTLDSLMATPWVVFARSTCSHSETVLAYLARYTHRIAISNQRLHAVDDKEVVFRYKDYATGGQQRLMRLPGQEFVRRLLLHVLPHGFMRIRHYGFLANCQRRKKLLKIRRCLDDRVASTAKLAPMAVSVVVPAESSCRMEPRCPKCERGVLRVTGEIASRIRRRPRISLLH